MIQTWRRNCALVFQSLPPYARSTNRRPAMGASTAVIQPSPTQIVRAFSGAVPSELSKSPLLGILGVVMGAGIVTLAGSMLTTGLADLKGHVVSSVDDGSWLSTAFNMALVFIGPFTVFLGGFFGPRRILLFAS